MKRKLLCRAVFLCAFFFALGSLSFPQENSWPQWGRNPQHTGTIGVAGQPINQILADFTYDPLVPAEQAANDGELLAHYQVPLLAGDDVFMESKTGDYTNPFNSQSWHQNRLHWEGGQLVVKWTFDSDWKPEPIDLVGWEPVYHAVLANGHIYDPGFGGTIFKLNRGDGTVVARINPFGTTIDPATFVAGPLSADSNGNVYYNVIQFDNLVDQNTIGSWLVKVAPDNSTSKVSYATLVPDAPTGANQCELPFGNSSLPWPPSTTARPALAPFPCGIQRAGVNVAPAIAPDGTIYTISRADNFSPYGYIVAVNPDLTPKWHTSLRVNLLNGCGVTVPIASSPAPEKGKCRFAANFGVDPATNHGAEGRVIDQSSSSPTVLPDGSVLYGAYSRYNVSRGNLLKFSSTGQFLAAYDFGWDSTPAVFSHDGTYSIVIKDNHYDEEEGFYCNKSSVPVSQIVCAFTGIPAGPFYITQLNANLVAEWKAHNVETQSCTPGPGGLTCVSDHPNGFEWCINAPAIDANHTVYVNSEDGHLYTIPQGNTGVFDLPPASGSGASRLFLRLAIGAAYTPLSIGRDGRIYTENGGHLFVVGE